MDSFLEPALGPVARAPVCLRLWAAATKGAATAGLVVTLTALLAYFLMIMGPFEGGQWNLTAHEIRGCSSRTR